MRASRREAMLGGLAIPAAAGFAIPGTRSVPVTIYDPDLVRTPPLGARAIEGDRVRFAAALFAPKPSLVVGISRHADALLIADVAREHGYRPVTAPVSAGPHGWALAPKR